MTMQPLPRVRANGIEHHVEIGGIEGPDDPVILVAGMGGALSYWGPNFAALGARHRVVAYDQRGTGRTDRVPVASIDQLADDLAALMDALGIARAHLVGHSTGGAIGLVLAARRPERVRSLVAYASIAGADAYRRRVWGLRKRILQTLGPEVYAQTTSLFFYPPAYIAANDVALREAEQRTATQDLGSADIMASRIDAILAFDFARELGRITAPTLVVCAKDDLLTPAYFSEAIAAGVPGARLALLDSGGHALSRSRPEDFNRIVLDFLAGA